MSLNKLNYMNYLKQGDIVDIIALASCATTIELKKVKIFLAKNGLIGRFFYEKELLLDKKPTNLFSLFAAETRFKQLLQALENKDSKAVWSFRGGYGSADILPFLEKVKPIKQQKLFIGFSDVTSVGNFLQQKWGWKIICAPMLAQLAFNRVTKKSQKAIFDLIFGKKIELKYDLITNYAGDLKNISAKKIDNKIVGGCLSVLAAHFGTKNQTDWRDKILFLEDIDESGERLDRYFTQLIKIMLEGKICPSAILLGAFKQGIPSRSRKNKNIDFAIKKFISNLEENEILIPVFMAKTNCLGHSKNMMPLVIGGEVEIHNGSVVQNNAGMLRFTS
jgi:muramoyltetrapeptide carboxypeptidase